MHYIKLYLRFIKAYMKSILEYRFNFFMDLFIQIYTYFIIYLGMWIILKKFHLINGWSFYEVMFLYNLNLISYGLCGIFFFTPIRRLEEMVREGTFDSLLIKPIDSFWHLIFRYFNHAFIGHVILAIIVFIICLGKLNIVWTFYKISWLVLFIFSATLIQAGLMITSSTICFWIFTTNTVIDSTIYGIRGFINYPIIVYDKIVQIILTFIVPYAFVNFYPSMFFFSKSKNYVFSVILHYCTPIVGVLIFSLSLILWKIGVNRYQSTGS